MLIVSELSVRLSVQPGLGSQSWGGKEVCVCSGQDVQLRQWDGMRWEKNREARWMCF